MIQQKIFEIISKGLPPEYLVKQLIEDVLNTRTVSTVAEERQFVLSVFRYFFAHNPLIESMQWEQGSYFNDNFCFYDLEDLRFNKVFGYSYNGFTADGWSINSKLSKDQFNWNFEIYDEDAVEVIENKYFDDNEKYNDTWYNLEVAALHKTGELYKNWITYITIFLKALYNHYGYYYYIYLFGREAKIHVNIERISIERTQPNLLSWEELKAENYNKPYSDY